MEELQSASHTMAQELYQRTAQAGASSGGYSSEGTSSSGATGSRDENVVDADYKVVDDEGK
jgi:molecular chaperone DnaK